jgi:hypothetical protein
MILAGWECDQCHVHAEPVACFVMGSGEFGVTACKACLRLAMTKLEAFEDGVGRAEKPGVARAAHE